MSGVDCVDEWEEGEVSVLVSGGRCVEGRRVDDCGEVGGGRDRSWLNLMKKPFSSLTLSFVPTYCSVLLG